MIQSYALFGEIGRKYLVCTVCVVTQQSPQGGLRILEEVGQVFHVGSAEKLERLSSYEIIKLFFRNLSSSRRALITLCICEQY